MSPIKFAFIYGKMIQNNTIVAQEIFYHLKKKKKRGRKSQMTIKINFMEWNFLLAILKCLGFLQKWINWIKECINHCFILSGYK